MNKNELKTIIKEVEKENAPFSNKAILDTLSFPPKIIGRQEKAKDLVRLFLGYKKGLVVPFVSIYGRSGSGKSTVVRFVCENLDGISYCFVNLRKAKTIFGCASLILSELGLPNLKNAEGINQGMQRIGDTIESVLEDKRHKLFVLVLDEIDVLFYDKRGKPSDFIYKLVTLGEKLRENGRLLCIVGISNNVMLEYELDDRVRSRIGSSEIFFEAYTKKDVLSILKDRAKKAFSKKIDPSVLEHCTDLSSQEHGDARRGIDLLRVAVELAGTKNKNLSKTHVDLASEQLQKDRVVKIVSSGSYHFRLACAALARITYLSDDLWHSTSDIYKQYSIIISKDTKPLSYRRISELLVEIQNTGIAVSQTSSKGRHGYGTQYKLTASPEIIGDSCFAEWWKDVAKRKKEHESSLERSELWRSKRGIGYHSNLSNLFGSMANKNWKDFSGLD